MTRRTRLAAMALASVAAVVAAVVSQHVFGMEPCPWCVLQRAIFTAIAIVCGLAALADSVTGRTIGGVLGLVLAAGGIAAALWQHFVAAASQSCNLTLADKIVTTLRLDHYLPSVFLATASCADAAVDLLGIRYELWSLALFALLAITAISVVGGRRGASA